MLPEERAIGAGGFSPFIEDSWIGLSIGHQIGSRPGRLRPGCAQTGAPRRVRPKSFSSLPMTHDQFSSENAPRPQPRDSYGGNDFLDLEGELRGRESHEPDELGEPDGSWLMDGDEQSFAAGRAPAQPLAPGPEPLTGESHVALPPEEEQAAWLLGLDDGAAGMAGHSPVIPGSQEELEPTQAVTLDATYYEPEPASRALSRAAVLAFGVLLLAVSGVAGWKTWQGGGLDLSMFGLGSDEALAPGGSLQRDPDLARPDNRGTRVAEAPMSRERSRSGGAIPRPAEPQELPDERTLEPGPPQLAAPLAAAPEGEGPPGESPAEPGEPDPDPLLAEGGDPAGEGLEPAATLGQPMEPREPVAEAVEPASQTAAGDPGPADPVAVAPLEPPPSPVVDPSESVERALLQLGPEPTLIGAEIALAQALPADVPPAAWAAGALAVASPALRDHARRLAAERAEKAETAEEEGGEGDVGAEAAPRPDVRPSDHLLALPEEPPIAPYDLDNPSEGVLAPVLPVVEAEDPEEENLLAWELPEDWDQPRAAVPDPEEPSAEDDALAILLEDDLVLPFAWTVEEGGTLAGGEPVGGELVIAEPVAEVHVTEEPVTEEPVAEAPVTEELVAEVHVTEEPVAEMHVTEELVAEVHVTEELVAETPVTEEPVAETTVTEELVAEEPVREEPVAELVTEEPAGEVVEVEVTLAETDPWQDPSEIAVDVEADVDVEPALGQEVEPVAEADHGESTPPVAEVVLPEHLDSGEPTPEVADPVAVEDPPAEDGWDWWVDEDPVVEGPEVEVTGERGDWTLGAADGSGDQALVEAQDGSDPEGDGDVSRPVDPDPLTEPVEGPVAIGPEPRAGGSEGSEDSGDSGDSRRNVIPLEEREPSNLLGGDVSLVEQYAAFLRSGGGEDGGKPGASDDGGGPLRIGPPVTAGPSNGGVVTVLPDGAGIEPLAVGTPTAGVETPALVGPGTERVAPTPTPVEELNPEDTRRGARSGRLKGRREGPIRWPGSTAPLELLVEPEKILTPKVGDVRLYFTSGETVQGRLHSMGQGTVWLRTNLGMVSYDGRRIDRIENLGTYGEAEVVSEEDMDYSKLPEVVVKTRGGTVEGRLISQDGEKVTIMTESGRMTLLGEVVPGGRGHHGRPRRREDVEKK